MKYDRAYEVIDLRPVRRRVIGPLAALRKNGGGVEILGLDHGQLVDLSGYDDGNETLDDTVPGRVTFHFVDGDVVLEELTLERYEPLRAWVSDAPSFSEPEKLHFYWVRRILEIE